MIPQATEALTGAALAAQDVSWTESLLGLGLPDWFSFVAVAFNSLGYMRPHGESLAYYLIEQRANQKGMTFQESASLFWHTLSMTIHRAHARNILTRFRDILCTKTAPCK